MLYALGSNACGQLGLGHKEDSSEPEKSILPDELPTHAIRITAGGNHTLALSSTGKLYATGNNIDGRCGVSQTEPTLTRFRTVQFVNEDGSKVSQFECCSATWEATVLAASNGQIYTCGTGNKGELGQGVGITESPAARALSDFPPQGTRVTDLTACISHAVAVLSNGHVYGWGNSRKGQIGKETTVCWSPTRFEGITFRAVRALCGKDYTIVLGAPEEGRYAYFGSEKSVFRLSAPITLPPWKGIGATWNGVYLLLHSGQVLAWGRNDHGQLPPANLPALKQIAVGSEHVIAVTKDDAVIAWGWGEHGNCGIALVADGPAKPAWNEIRLPHPHLQTLTVAAGCATSWIVET